MADNTKAYRYQNELPRQKSGMIFDFWACGPAQNVTLPDGSKFRGAYPAKFLDHFKEAFVDWMPDLICGSYYDDILEVCAGSLPREEAIRIDINPQFSPDIVADAETFAEKFLASNPKVSISRADPPYNENRADKYYGQPLLSVIKMLKQMALVTKVGGLVCLLDQKSPSIGPHIPNLKRIALIAVSSLPNQDLRCFTVWVKTHELET